MIVCMCVCVRALIFFFYFWVSEHVLLLLSIPFHLKSVRFKPYSRFCSLSRFYNQLLLLLFLSIFLSSIADYGVEINLYLYKIPVHLEKNTELHQIYRCACALPNTIRSLASCPFKRDLKINIPVPAIISPPKPLTVEISRRITHFLTAWSTG